MRDEPHLGRFVSPPLRNSDVPQSSLFISILKQSCYCHQCAIHHLLDQLNSPICLFLSLISNDRFGHFAWGKLTPLLLQGNRSSSYCSASFKIYLERRCFSERCLEHSLVCIVCIYLKTLLFFFFLRIFKLHVLGIDFRFFSAPSPEGYFFFVNVSVFHTECKNIQTVLLNTVFI